MTNLAIDFSWQAQAECKGLPVDLFFVGTGGLVSQEVKDACNRCPVKEECLSHALKHEDHGYWAGTTERERARMRQSLKIVMKKPESSYWEANPIVGVQRKEIVRESSPCGTFAAYQKHMRKKETVDPACREAQQEYRRKYKEKYEKKK